MRLLCLALLLVSGCSAAPRRGAAERPNGTRGAEAPAAEAALLSTRWRAETSGGPAEESSFWGPTLAFESARAVGSSGCDPYHAGFRLRGDSLRFVQIEAGSSGCRPRPDRIRRALAYLEALGEVRTYSIDGSTLTLRDAGGKAVLVFKPAGTAWLTQRHRDT
ncbi:MAG TPA: META domain-containing protein, partial [Longimicrobium sp.]